MREFRKHQAVTEPTLVDMLVFKGRNELDEALTRHKTYSHIMRYFDTQTETTLDERKKEFMRKFVERFEPDDVS